VRFLSFESFQSWLAIDVNIAVRFSLTTLAVIALFTGFREIFSTRKLNRPIVFTAETYSLFFVNRVLIALSVVLSAPAAAWRLGATHLPPSLSMWLFILGNVCLCLYFLISETIRLVLTNDMDLREAIRASWIFVAAAVILGALGFILVWT
jgi:hypothetical protein